MVGDKFIESFFDLHQGWNFLEYKFLLIGDVIKGYQMILSVGSFPSIKPQSVLGRKMLV